MAIQRQVTAAWISLATILIAQLNPPHALVLSTLKTGLGGPEPEAEVVVREALPVLLSAGLSVMSVVGVMESVSVVLVFVGDFRCRRVLNIYLRIRILCKNFLCVWIE
jgi:hypothetical protein